MIVSIKPSPSTIFWTWTDEVPALATLSLLPIVQAFLKPAGISVQTSDISLAGRILAGFPEYLEEKARIPDWLSLLGEFTHYPEANIIKLPNISASVPQLTDAIHELQSQGYAVPDYPQNPRNDQEKIIRTRYAAILGSAVNPVIREGNSDRRLPLSVKEFGRKHPVRLGAWSPDSRSHVAHMPEGDFYGSETALTVSSPATVCYEFIGADGSSQMLKENVHLQKDDIIDAAVMNVRMLRAFFQEQIEDARQRDVLFSLHIKATMMKVSDPVIFGHAVSVYYEPFFQKHAAILQKLGINPENGIGEALTRILSLPPEQRTALEADLENVYALRPPLAMVNADSGITNLHLPNNVIIDASMPVMIRNSGKMRGPDSSLKDTKAVIPDRCYAVMYKTIVEDCKQHGALDPATMGSVPNVGLMAQQAEEYGSHDTTFIAAGPGVIRIQSASTGAVLLEQRVEQGDIFRSCRTTDASIRDWVGLAVQRARITQTPAIFWLDEHRAHDVEVIKKVEKYLGEYDLQDLDIRILDPEQAMECTLRRIRKGKDTISVTGNVLRDYLTDLFPILEVGTSGKMLSIVPLLAGGGMFETGAGGSAPDLFRRFREEGFLAWVSLGEFTALAASLEHMAVKFHNFHAAVLSKTLDQAIGQCLDNDKSPALEIGGLDTRGSHFYLALYWAQALAGQTEDPAMQTSFIDIARQLTAHESAITADLLAAQGKPVDMGGYYHPDIARTSQAMRPSKTLNAIIAAATASAFPPPWQ